MPICDCYTLRNGTVIYRTMMLSQSELARHDRNSLKELAVQLRKDSGWQGSPSGTEIGQDFTKEELIAFVMSVASGATSKPALPVPSWPAPAVAGPDPETVPDFTGESNRPEIPGADLDCSLEEQSEAQRKLDLLKELFGSGQKVDMRQVEAVVESKLARTVESLNANYGAFTQACDTLVQETIPASVAAEFERLLASQARTIRIENILTGSTVNVGLQHERFPALLRRVQIALEASRKMGRYMNIWLVGPAGGGKTTACEKIAEALELPFEFNGALDSEHKLLGFVDAQGRIVSRPFRRIWENGGIYLFDEVDASLPGACLALNAALANGYCDFPDGKVFRNKDAVCLAAGNVWNGPTEEYVGRYRPDAAFADRFIKFRWDYDERLERALAGSDEWVSYVQRIRRRARETGTKLVVSPRASIYGALLIAGDVPRDEVIEETIRKGCPQELWDVLTSNN